MGVGLWHLGGSQGFVHDQWRQKLVLMMPITFPLKRISHGSSGARPDTTGDRRYTCAPNILMYYKERQRELSGNSRVLSVFDSHYPRHKEKH